MANILIIEDNFMNLEMASELLKNAGHSIISTENANDGIKLAKLKSPDLILMDLSLPEMDGLTATKILKQDPLTENIPIVAFTALVMNSDKEKAFGAGCAGFIPKPIEVSTFSTTVEKYLRSNAPEIKIIQENSEKILYEQSDFNEDDDKPNLKHRWHKVLIVDDNPMNTELLKETLEQIGQSSVIAYSGKKALELVGLEKFDLILLDIMMPEMSGYEVIEHLKANPKTAEIPVIFISALNETSDIVKGLDLSSYGYVTKPYNIEELKAKILGTLRIKDLQDQLRTETKKLELIYKFSADGIVMLNSSFEIVSCNEKFVEWIGFSIEKIIGENFCQLVKCEYDRKNCCNTHNLLFADSLDSNKNITREISIESNNQKRIIDANLSKINNKEAETEGYILILRDVTAYKEVEKQKETFVATLTHDLKTPIRAEIRALELLLKGNFGALTPDQKDIIQDTLYSSKYMSNMVDNLLSTYRYENGSVKLRKDNTDINLLIKSCYEELKYLTEEKKQEISFNFEDQNLIAQIDELEIKRVIMNLLSNAISYTPDRGKIIVKTNTNNKKIKVSFIDNGKGISKEEISNLFNKYTSYAKKFRQVGTGLGLYLCKQVISAHDGDIFVESTEGKGSTFTFSIPVIQDNNPAG
ncbi:MAG: multi-sensor signal transduction histidine kinase [uncultured bacterium]|nr:MAG: multi-sensor signal transduction histidine kinase [uncultured bacterium]